MEIHSPKALEILKAAQSLMQDVGYNGFSFRDVAAKVGIKSASIHYHYPTKGDLAEAAAVEYRQSFLMVLDDIFKRSDTARECLQSYGAIYANTLIAQQKTCLCGILAGEAEVLPEPVRSQINGFFDEQRDWLADVIERGKANDEFRADIETQIYAATILSALEGAMVIARSTAKPDHLQQTIDMMISLIEAKRYKT